MIWLDDMQHPNKLRSALMVSTVLALLFSLVIYLFYEQGFMYVNLLAILTYSPGFLVLLCILTANAFRSVNGRELFVGSLSCQVNTQPVPDHGNVIRCEALPESSKDHSGLQHSIYDNELCVQLVALAIRSYTAQKNVQVELCAFQNSAALV